MVESVGRRMSVICECALRDRVILQRWFVVRETHLKQTLLLLHRLLYRLILQVIFLLIWYFLLIMDFWSDNYWRLTVKRPFLSQLFQKSRYLRTLIISIYQRQLKWKGLLLQLVRIADNQLQAVPVAPAISLSIREFIPFVMPLGGCFQQQGCVMRLLVRF